MFATLTAVLLGHKRLKLVNYFIIPICRRAVSMSWKHTLLTGTRNFKWKVRLSE